MLNFKYKLRQEIIDQDFRRRSTDSFSAIALPGYKKRGKYCKIRFENENGEFETAKGEINTLYGNETTGGWYPKHKETVLVERSGDDFIIVSPLINNYEDHISQYELKSDVYSSTITGSSPSTLY